MIGGFSNISKIQDLKNRVLFTLAMLVVYRVGAHIPTPGIDGQALSAFFSASQGTLLGFFDMFSGGALSRLTVFALGIMPYIDAAIIIELLTVVFPYLERLAKEGEAGRRKITQYTRYGTVGIGIIQSFGISYGLESMSSPSGTAIVPSPGWAFRFMTIVTLTAGTCFLMWLGEQISDRGIGNGISLIITAGIIVRIPSGAVNLLRLVKSGDFQPYMVLILAVLMGAVIGAIVFVEKGERRVTVQYAKRVVGRKMYGGQTNHIPLKINTAGVIPVIFASSIIMFPATIARFVDHPWMQYLSQSLSPGNYLYDVLFVLFIVFFCYFYTAIVFNPTDLADNMKKQGGYLPGIRPGKSTAEYIDKILTRLTFSGAVYLSAVSLLPTFLMNNMNVPFFFGGIALLIVVQVVLDTVNQIESHMMQRYYDGFMAKPKAKKR
ncbi:MAG: preprotein translocase subunit SecY [bacterium]